MCTCRYTILLLLFFKHFCRNTSLDYITLYKYSTFYKITIVARKTPPFAFLDIARSARSWCVDCSPVSIYTVLSIFVLWNIQMQFNSHLIFMRVYQSSQLLILLLNRLWYHQLEYNIGHINSDVKYFTSRPPTERQLISYDAVPDVRIVVLHKSLRRCLAYSNPPISNVIYVPITPAFSFAAIFTPRSITVSSRIFSPEP